MKNKKHTIEVKEIKQVKDSEERNKNLGNLKKKGKPK